MLFLTKIQTNLINCWISEKRRLVLMLADTWGLRTPTASATIWRRSNARKRKTSAIFCRLGGEFIKEKKKIRKQENTHSSKKKELVQEKTIMVKNTRSRPRKRSRKKKFYFLERFLSRERVFFSEFFFSCTSSFVRVRVFLTECMFSCFLTFFFSFINSQPRS